MKSGCQRQPDLVNGRAVLFWRAAQMRLMMRLMMSVTLLLLGKMLLAGEPMEEVKGESEPSVSTALHHITKKRDGLTRVIQI